MLDPTRRYIRLAGIGEIVDTIVDRSISTVPLERLWTWRRRSRTSAAAAGDPGPGANIKVVQTMLGHASATLTWDRYGHLYPDDLDVVRGPDRQRCADR